MSSPQRSIVASWLLLAAWSFAEPAGAQMRKPGQIDPPAAAPATQKDQEPFVDVVNVSVVNVDVYVTDKQGRPVTGLTKEDFQLFENKRPVEITNFYAADEGRPPPPPEEVAAAAAAPAPAHPGQEAEQVKTPAEQRLSLIVYIDNFNLRPFNRNRVMSELGAFNGQKLSKGDQLMLVTYDRELHVRRHFTNDSSLIARAMSALKKMIDALAGMPGRKAVLYVSDGLQMIAGQDVFYAVQNKYGEQSTSLTQVLEFDTSRRFTELTAQANANRIPFYTIDAAALRVYESPTAENRGPGPASPGFSQMIDSVRIHNLQSPLQMMAERTGGMAIINTNV